MIGTAIKDALIRLDYNVLKEFIFDWQDAAESAEILGEISSTLVQPDQNPQRISVVWSAGLADFHSGKEEVESENLIFMKMLQFACNLNRANHSLSVDFHYMGSAGGLFEGQRLVGPDALPFPHRPYGQMKLLQEQALTNSIDNEHLTIYRPSSVYGPMVQKSSKGLVNNLVRNGLKGQETSLDACVMALRDYVFSDDVGQFVGKCIRNGKSGVFFLVSSKSTSIFEVVKKVERVLKLRLRVRYDEYFGNNMNITFSDRLLPQDWHPVTMEVGIRQFLIIK